MELKRNNQKTVVKEKTVKVAEVKETVIKEEQLKAIKNYQISWAILKKSQMSFIKKIKKKK